MLEDRYGQEAEIPYVFRCGKLKKPEDEIERAIRKKLDAVKTKGAAGLDWDGESEEIMDDLEKIERRQKERYGVGQDGLLAGMVDIEGDEIHEIARDGQRMLMDEVAMEHDQYTESRD